MRDAGEVRQIRAQLDALVKAADKKVAALECEAACSKWGQLPSVVSCESCRDEFERGSEPGERGDCCAQWGDCCAQITCSDCIRTACCSDM